jgi:uncharacterized protein (DUF433 family)
MSERRFSTRKPTMSIIPGFPPSCNGNGKKEGASDCHANGKPKVDDPIFGNKPPVPYDGPADDDLEDEHSEAYAEFATAFKVELQPQGIIETYFADRVVLTAWRLQRAAWEAGTDPTFDEPELQRAEDRAERALMKALAYLEKLRARRERKNSVKAASKGSKSALLGQIDGPRSIGTGPKPGASAGSSPTKPGAKDNAGPADASTDWRPLLMFDPQISTDSPIVKGTAITVKHVVTMVVDGHTWADIVRAHPQLTEDDIRACLWYAMEEENASLRLK